MNLAANRQRSQSEAIPGNLNSARPPSSASELEEQAIDDDPAPPAVDGPGQTGTSPMGIGRRLSVNMRGGNSLRTSGSSASGQAMSQSEGSSTTSPASSYKPSSPPLSKAKGKHSCNVITDYLHELT